MALQGIKKRDYQREYMRRKRGSNKTVSGLLDPKPLRLKPVPKWLSK